MEKYVVSYLIKQNEKKIARINIQIYEPPGSTNVFQVKIGWVMTGSIGKGPQPPPPPIIPTSPQMIQIIDNNLFKGAGARSVEVTY